MGRDSAHLASAERSRFSGTVAGRWSRQSIMRESVCWGRVRQTSLRPLEGNSASAGGGDLQQHHCV